MTSSYRYKITIEYLGARYCGWQRQKETLSIQQILEEAIYKFSKETVTLVAAGRTDAGVNAYGQVAHFDLKQNFEPRRLMHSINHFCRGRDVGVVNAEYVNSDFHARFSAKSRHYVYKILNRPSVNIVQKKLVSWIRPELNIFNMQQGANYLIGTHDFSSFRASQCQATSAIKTIDRIEIIKTQDEIQIYCSALSFLHHMVRNIVGSLIMVGKGTWPPEKINHILMAQDRKAAGPTAPSLGLYFLKVDY
ncbi:MAG: tRNA pseudouridine(38-40) synthase TruA [Rickettsiaceae bacterium]